MCLWSHNKISRARQLIKNGNVFHTVMEDEKSDINMLALSGEGALCIQDGAFILYSSGEEEYCVFQWMSSRDLLQLH